MGVYPDETQIDAKRRRQRAFGVNDEVNADFAVLGFGYAAVRRTIFILYPSILSDGMFNFIVMQTLFYVPFFMLGALAFINPNLKALFTTPSRGCTLGAACAFVAYLLNQRYGNGDAGCMKPNMLLPWSWACGW